MTELPTTFGKYFLTELLATGGMAEIYLAKLVGPGGFEKPLVIKQIHPRLSGERQFVDLFVAEAKTLVSLAHGNIVPVYELGVIDDTYFIVMEYIDGPTLYRFTEALARRGERLPPAVAAWIAARILEGLDYAHHKGDGVIHRDLSPRNVMLSRDGEVKLVDFGIAVTLGTAGEGDDAHEAPTGSFPYMSPEQVRKEPLTRHTDLFSVGVLLWEMLVGRRLFARPDPDATLAAVTDGEIPLPSSVNPAVPARLDDVVMRALARDRTERWPSAREMLHELQRYLYSLDETPGPRDLAALVARYCPPETRRLPTHADPPIDPLAATSAPGEGGEPAADGDLAAAALPGPSTAKIERLPPKLRRKRTETFATHVALKDMIERATPLVPMPALPQELEPPPPPSSEPPPPSAAASSPSGPSAAASPRSSEPPPSGPSAAASPPSGASRADTPATAPRADAHPADDSTPDPGHRPAPPALPVPGRTPPSRGLLVFLALGTFALGAAAIFVFLRGRARHADPDPALVLPAAADAPAPPDDAAAPPADADSPAPPADAASPASFADAAPAVPALPDGGPRPPPPDAAPSLPDAAAARPDSGRPDPARPTGDATLVIGANPWGDIFIDGVRKGRTPTTLVVPAGKHAIEVVFGGEDPPRTKRFSIDLRAGETQQLDADFTKP